MKRRHIPTVLQLTPREDYSTKYAIGTIDADTGQAGMLKGPADTEAELLETVPPNMAGHTMYIFRLGSDGTSVKLWEWDGEGWMQIESAPKLYESSEEYYVDHAVCPSCGNSDVSSTYIGFIFQKGRPFKDTNRCHCHSCSWEGITDDMKPKSNAKAS